MRCFIFAVQAGWFKQELRKQMEHCPYLSVITGCKLERCVLRKKIERSLWVCDVCKKIIGVRKGAIKAALSGRLIYGDLVA